MRRVALVTAVLLGLIGCGGDESTGPSSENSLQKPPVTGTPSGLGGVTFATTTLDGLTITTDKDDYAPGDTVRFTGSGWPANDTLDITLDAAPTTHPPHTWRVAVRADGTFRASTYIVDIGELGVTLTLTAVSRSTGKSPAVQFTDGTARIDIAPAHYAAAAGVSRRFSVLVRNTDGGFAAKCIRMTVPAGYTSVTFSTPTAGIA